MMKIKREFKKPKPLVIGDNKPTKNFNFWVYWWDGSWKFKLTWKVNFPWDKHKNKNVKTVIKERK